MDLDAFRELQTPVGRRALAQADRLNGADLVAAAQALRRDFEPYLAAAALTQARLRVRARKKFGDDAARMYFTPDGLEQATRADVAEHRARRFAGTANVADVCCGIGGDLLAIARVAQSVHAVDRDHLTAEVAGANVAALHLDAYVSTADASEIEPGRYDALFADPARRTHKGRTFDPDSYSPPWPVIREMAQNARAGCVKVAPGIPHELVPDGAEAEWVSYRGEVKEAAIWFGELAGATRIRATLLPSGVTLTTTASGPPGVGPPGRFLYEPDGAAIRAHLVAEVAAQVGGRLLDERVAYITADDLRPTPWASPYEIMEIMPFSLKRLRQTLRERDVGSLTIKKRAMAVDIDRLRKDLKPTGSQPATVVLTRIGTKPYALICRPARVGSPIVTESGQDHIT